MENTPKVGVGVIVRKEKKILFGKRIGTHGADSWQFPGGHLEFGESWEQCAKREVKEEVGITIDNVKFFTATNDIFINDHKHYITLFIESEYKSGELCVKEPDKCVEWRWLAKEELPNILFLPIENLIKAGHNLFR